ncbi:secreted RxLR effector peptide protein, putative [Phytophthora infestans T30-4]|uniref:Secreted RxLR effector peptide protein, putative n=2 Tax=Phytophthora infestans TaxID=4787 RepID=D0MUD5_PHYIT|nr:secreted RxLR effector peptide protein, putative [Phytophthora infestans T30-4]EEY61582.1 secreted RxLR effector peptide protein, putative [Phytophthora infestans T30-4]KAF4149241.1 hypothetical protein GN958_ATG01552 [Phytophthora infestans]|eukprot:XP_002908499.1 secreted RxLR effector peptide protein, putative [Phytophthora infestans T30-4]
MRLVCVIFSILFLLAGFDAGSALVDSEKAYINRRAPTAERHLRSTSEARNDKIREERAGTSSVQHIADKVAAKLMEKMSMNPSSIFSRLRFGEAGAKLSSNN